jgi:rhodanese-related sulfurtransferase
MIFRRTPEVRVEQVEALLAEGAALMDVREQYEWEAGHAPQADHLPMGELALDSLPAGRPLLVVCHVGGRSAAATDALVRAGVEAVNVAGGMDAWARAGMPVVTDGGEPGQVV